MGVVGLGMFKALGLRVWGVVRWSASYGEGRGTAA